jgi:hypothetical protein
MAYELADDFDTRGKVQDILKSKYPEFPTLPTNSLQRISYKLMNLKQSPFKAGLSTEISKHIFNLIADEKLSTKAKIFSYWSKLSSDLFLADYTQKLQILLKDIRGQIENYDQNIIQSLLNGLIYFEDTGLANETLKEICDILTMTIKHRVDSIRYEFVLRVIKSLNEIEYERAVTHEHLQTWIDYLINNIPAERGQNVVPIFRLMRRHKYEDKAQVEKLYNILAEKSSVIRLQADENTDAFRNVVKSVLGQSAVDGLHNTVLDELKNKTESNTAKGLLINLQKAVIFSQANTNEVADKIFQNLAASVNNTELIIPKFRPIFQEIARNSQYLRAYRDQVVDLILNKLVTNLSNLEQASPPQRIATLINIMEFPLFTQDHHNNFKTLKQAVLKDVDIQGRFLNMFINELQDGNLNLSKNLHNRLHSTVRDFVTNRDFIERNGKAILRQLITINYYFTNQNRKNIEISDNDSFVKLADNLKDIYPDLKVMTPAGKIIRLVKHFDMINIESKALNLELVESLKIGITNFNDQILCLSKLVRLNIPEKKEVFYKYITDENVVAKFNEINFVTTKCRFYNLITSANKAGLISDEKVKELQRQMADIVKNQTEKPLLRIEAAVAMTNAKNEIIKDLDVKDLSTSLKEVFSELSSTKRLTRFLEQLNSRDEITMAILNNLSAIYIKEVHVDKAHMLKFLDLFTKFKWRSTQFYNKVISDYEEVFDRCNSNDHAAMVNSFARINLKKDDVIKAAVKNIRLNLFDPKKKATLFNDLVLLGYHDQEWKDIILSKLVSEMDIFGRNPINLSFKTLASLWVLNDWPANRDEVVKHYITI